MFFNELRHFDALFNFLRQTHNIYKKIFVTLALEINKKKTFTA